MKLLELFSGAKSVGKVAETLGFDVVSLDLKHADINTDILNWDFNIYEPKHLPNNRFNQYSTMIR